MQSAIKTFAEVFIYKILFPDSGNYRRFFSGIQIRSLSSTRNGLTAGMIRISVLGAVLTESVGD